MAEKENYYTILGVDKNSSPEEIKKAYRMLSMKWHPDRNQNSEESTVCFQKITQAYNTLSDDKKRSDYDMMLVGGGGLGGMRFSTHSQHFPAQFNPADILNFFSGNIFEQFQNATGGGNGNANGGIPTNFTMFGKNIRDLNKQMNKPVPIIKNEEITLSKAFTGCTLPIEVVRGIVENGITREEKETLYLTIPQGIDNNEMLILREKGHVHADNNKGDVKIFIKVLNNTEFTRNGLDLILQKTISLKDALCGFSFDMKYIDDRIFKINNGKGNIITHNYKKVLPKMGIKRGEHVGNLIIDFNVVFPENLTNEQMTGLANIL
jgi:DnaJ-class molecular chaperone